jgi:ribose transport system permease protein
MKRPRNLGLDRFSGLYLWAFFIVVFSIWAPSLFPTTSTLHSTAAGQAVPAILAVALLLPLAANTYDLSVGATANLTAIVAVSLQTTAHVGMVMSMIIAVLCGMAIGVINGFIVVKMKVNSFIATLGMGSVIAASQTIVSGNNQPLPPSSPTWSNLTSTTVFGFQIIVVYMLIIAVVVWWVMAHTPAGRYLYAIGSNTEAARLSGVKVGKWVWLSLIGSGTLAGVAGVAYGSLLGPSLTFGQTLLLPAFAAAFLGSTQLIPGRFNVWGTVLAIYVLATGVQGFADITSVQWLSDMFDGVALIAAVAFAIWRQQSGPSRRQHPDSHSENNPTPPDPVEGEYQLLPTVGDASGDVP